MEKAEDVAYEEATATKFEPPPAEPTAVAPVAEPPRV